MSGLLSRVRGLAARSLVGLLALTHLFVLLPATQAQAANPVNAGDIVLNEIYPHPAAGQSELVELYNVSDKNFDKDDLAGLMLEDSKGNKFGTNYVAAIEPGLAAHGFLVITDNGTTLNNSGDSVILKNGATVLDQFSYPDSKLEKSWARVPNGTGAFLPDQFPSIGSINQQALDTPKITLKAENKKITASWEAVTGATGYLVNITPKGTDFDPAKASTDHDTSHAFIGLTNGQAYDVQVLAQGDHGTSLPAVASATPGAQVEASIVYYQNGKAGTLFGPGTITAEVTPAHADDLTADDKPVLTLSRPGNGVFNAPLTFKADKNKWYADYPISKASAKDQDGTVTAKILTSEVGKEVTLQTGGSFSVDTLVAKPVVHMNSRCTPQQDSFVADATEPDIERIYIYRAASVDLPNLIAVGNIVNGKTDEIFIGDNRIGALYLVAQDRVGNRSDVVETMNDITSPVPHLQLESKDKSITATWDAIGDATAYIVRWKEVNASDWQQATVTTNHYDITGTNGKEYEVQVSSRDAACNQSAFASVKATPHRLTAQAGRGGAADREGRILGAAMARGGEKDQLTTGGKSPYSLEEDKDQNGIKDVDEDRNHNGIKDVDEDLNRNGIKDGDEDLNHNGIKDRFEAPGTVVVPTPTASPSVTVSPSASESPSAGGGFSNLFKNRSGWIVTLAVLLIVLGAGLAAYSWYRGDNNGEGDLDKESKDDTKSSKAPEEEDSTTEETTPDEKPRRGRGGRRRKSRW